MSGVVRDQKTGKPAEAKIIYSDLDSDEELGEAYSNPQTGEYKIVLPYGKRYAIRAERKDLFQFQKTLTYPYQELLKKSRMKI